MQTLPIDFSKANILVIGDIMLDQYLYGVSTRVSPEAPIPIVKHNNKKLSVGGAANVAANIKALGANVTLLGIIGKDSSAKSLIKILDDKKINHYLSQDSKTITITKTRVVANGQQVVRIDEEEIFSPEQTVELYQHYEHIVKDYDVVILSDYHKGTLHDPQHLIRCADEHHKIVFVDPKGKDYNKYKNVFCITPNNKEFSEICEANITSEEDIAQQMEKLATSLNIQALLLTRGAKGMTLWQKSQDNHPSIINIPTEAKTVYDVSGAGDTVIATLACGCARLHQAKNAQEHRHILQESVRCANQAAGIAVAQIGSYAVSIQELNRSYSQQSAKYVKNTQHLANLIEEQKNSNKTIVFTNGCFDILHSGHIQCLEEASKLGDILIVALNSDTSVTRLKGKQRPINSLIDRIEVLSALSAVDWIVDFGDNPQDNDTPINLIQTLKPDILVKGGDYNCDTIVGADFVNSYGGKVHIVKLKKGYSSTKVINSMQAEKTEQL